VETGWMVKSLRGHAWSTEVKRNREREEREKTKFPLIK